MTTATLTTIGAPSESWGDHRLVFLDLTFSDHAPASLATNEQGLASRLRELNERIGKPADYEFGQNQKGKATVKIPKEERESGGGGGKWQPQSPEERAQIFAKSMLEAAVALTQDEHGAIMFTRAVDMVVDGAERFLTEARRLLGVEASAVRTSDPDTGRVGTGNVAEGSVGRPVPPRSTVPASTSHSGSEAGGEKPPILETSEPEQTSGGDDSSSSPPDQSGPDGKENGEGSDLSGPPSPQQLETLVNVYGSKPTVIRRAHALLGFSGGWDELTAEDARRLILHQAGVPS